MKFLEKNIKNPYISIETTNFVGTLKTIRIIKAIASIAIIILAIMGLPPMISTFFKDLFTGDLKVVHIFVGFMFSLQIVILPLITILSCDMIAAIISCEEKLRKLTSKEK